MRPRARILVTAASVTALLLAGSSPGHATSVAGGTPDTSAATVSASAAQYDGETLYSGLILGQGPVAEAHPDLVAAGLEQADPAVQAEFTDLVIGAVPAVDPTFFDSFAAALTSGDRVQIDRALTSAEEILTTTLTQELGATVQETVDDQSGTCVLLVVVVVSHLTAGAVVNAAVNVNVAWNVNYAWTIGSVPQSESGLDKEQWVDAIAETFAS